MNEATSSKTSKVNILSDIVLNPLRTPPQNVNLSSIPPLAPLSTVNEGSKGVNKTENVSVSTVIPTSQQIPLTSDTSFATIQATEESLKRKSAGIFAYQATPKKSKLKALKDPNENKEKAEEASFFNYMTGTYETQAKIELPKVTKEGADIKEEVTIQEHFLQVAENIAETEEEKQEESKDKIQVVTSPEKHSDKDLKQVEKKATLTIDLTDDDDTETNVTVNNNIFIKNVLALQNAITLQSLLKPKSNSKIPLQNFVIQSPGNSVTNLQGNVIMKSPSSMISNSVKNTLNVSQPSSVVSQPMFLMVKNNSPFLVPQSMVSAKSMNHNNLQSNLMVIPNNLNFIVAKDSPYVSNITNLGVNANKSPEKNIVMSSKNTSLKRPSQIASKGLVTKNVGLILVPTTCINSPLDFSTSVTNSKNSNRLVQPPKVLPSLSGTKLDVSPGKPVTTSLQNSPKNHINLQSFNSFSQNLQSSAQNIVNSSQHFIDLNTLNNYTQELSSTSPNSTSSGSNAASLQKFQTSNTFAQNLTNALQNFICQTCLHKARSKRDLILHIYHAHLQDEYELNLKCKVCNFETYTQSVMEKHDLEHGDGSKNQENVDNIPLSNNVEIRIRMDKRKDQTIGQKRPCSENTNVPIDVIDLADSDDDILSKKEPPSVQIFRCFECNFLYSSKRRSLQNHAAKHVPSKYQCPKHSIIKDSCAECDYQKYVTHLERNMLVCKKCDYRTCWKQSLDAHQCDNEKVTVDSDSNSEKDYPPSIFKCFHCSHVTHSLDLLKYHAIRHFGGAFACDVHQPQKSMLCDKCVYEMILKDLKDVVHLCNCGFRTLDKKEYSSHTSRKVHCQEFTNRVASGQSLETYYGSLENFMKDQNSAMETRSNRKLPNTKRNVNRSSSAGKSKDLRKRATDEVLSSDTEIEEHSGDFKCFHCTYTTKSRDLLKFHAVKHCEQPVDCTLHPQATSASCKMCLYKILLEEVKKKILLCLDCGFRTLRRPTYTRHTSNPGNCEMYRKKIANEALEQSENESDADIRKAENSSIKRKQKGLAPFIICAKCNYKAMDKEIFKLHEKSHEIVKGGIEHRHEQLEGNTSLNCFDCNAFCTEDREKLKEHSVGHYKKKFFCDKHVPTQKDEYCGKCIYHSIKKEMENEILTCNNCQFKTIRLEVYEQHKTLNSCREHKKALEDNEDDDDYVPDHDVDSGHKSRDSHSNKDKYNLRKRHTTGSVENKSGNQYRTSSSTVTTSETSHKFECMDCSSRYHNESELETHVESHQSSTFTCDDHTYFNELCKKCLYQYVLERTSKKNLLCCTCCGFECSKIDIMHSHINSNIDCDSFSKILNSLGSSNEVTKEVCVCYDCDKKFNSRQKLWNHASRHRSDFQCSDHLEFSEKDCGKCVYAFIRKTQRLYYFRCFDCSYKIFASELDLKDHVEKQHEDATFKCDMHLSGPSGENCELCQYAYIVAQKCRNVYYCTDCSNRDFPYATWKNLKLHVMKYHKNSVTHCFCHYSNRPYLECLRCFYEKVLAYVRFQDPGRGYQCFECPVKVFTREQLEAHVRLIHEDSVFQCTNHSLGDINEKCNMCQFESVVVLMNNS